MLKNNLNYPYPMLKVDSRDYKESVIKESINMEIDKTTSDYVLTVNIDINNFEINNLILKGICEKGIIIKSNTVWFKKFFPIRENSTIRLKPYEVYGRVELLPCVVAKEKIDPFYSSDFSDEFMGVDVIVNSGEIIAIGEEQSFDALLENDLFKNTSSIFQFQIDENIKNIDYNIDDSEKIIIFLPKKIHKLYKNIVFINKELMKSILNSILVSPVLLSVLYEMKDHKENYVDKKWYKTICKTVEQKLDQGIAFGFQSNGDVKDPIIAMQTLTKGLIETALEDFYEHIENYD